MLQSVPELGVELSFVCPPTFLGLSRDVWVLVALSLKESDLASLLHAHPYFYHLAKKNRAVRRNLLVRAEGNFMRTKTPLKADDPALFRPDLKRFGVHVDQRVRVSFVHFSSPARTAKRTRVAHFEISGNNNLKGLSFAFCTSKTFKPTEFAFSFLSDGTVRGGQGIVLFDPKRMASEFAASTLRWKARDVISVQVQVQENQEVCSDDIAQHDNSKEKAGEDLTGCASLSMSSVVCSVFRNGRLIWSPCILRFPADRKTPLPCWIVCVIPYGNVSLSLIDYPREK